MSDSHVLDRYGSVAENVADVRRRIVAAGGSTNVEIVAVTKGHPAEAILAATDAGLTLFGENYADELVSKSTDARIAALRDRNVRFTFQGRLQTNKINKLRDHVALWQTVDTEDRAIGLGKRAPGAAVLLQLNLTGQPQQGGVEPSGIENLFVATRGAGLHLVGVMAIGPTLDPTSPESVAEVRSVFEMAISVADRFDLPVRSLGMSDDFEIAISAGSTLIRLGSVLFGQRPATLI